jgi:hypothetical protein
VSGTLNPTDAFLLNGLQFSRYVRAQNIPSP